MSSLRSHDDTWDIATSVGSTAVMVAAARAKESEGPDPLITDPYASILVAGAGTGMWENFLDAALQQRIADADPDAAAMFANMLGYQAVRTHFFDAFFADAVAAGIHCSATSARVAATGLVASAAILACMALVVMAIASVASWGLLRYFFGKNLGEVKRWDRDINEN